jgi:uncharacterized membrane protein
MMSLAWWLLLLNALLMGLVAGLLYGVAITVNRGLSAIADDRVYVTSHNSINRAISPFNSLVFVVPVTLVAATFTVYREAGSSLTFWSVLGSLILYVVGVLGVTVIRNIPLFRAMWRIDPGHASPEELAEARMQHETAWHFWHNIRTGIGVMAFALALVGFTAL